MNLVKTSLLNGVAVAVRMLTLLGINKVLAIYVGPAGYAALGQLQNLVQVTSALTSNVIGMGVTKYTAEYYEEEEKQERVWQTAGAIALIISIISGMIIFILSYGLAIWILNDQDYRSIFLWFAFSIVFITGNNFFLSILNGRREIVRYFFANIIGSMIALAMTAILTVGFNLYGAMLALVTYQAICFFSTLIIIYNMPWFKISNLLGVIDKNIMKTFCKYAMAPLAAAVCVPVAHSLIRNYLGATLGWTAAGHWEAMTRVSGAYLLLATTTLGVYFLPKFSELKDAFSIQREIMRGYKILFPFSILVGLLVYFFKDFIVVLLFTKDFMPMKKLFAWQIVGDILKIGAFVLSYLMLGKAMIKLFVATEVIFSFLSVVLSILFIRGIGIEGVVFAHAFNYAIYFLTLVFFLKKYIFANKQWL